jgi:hypothetical protein
MIDDKQSIKQKVPSDSLVKIGFLFSNTASCNRGVEKFGAISWKLIKDILEPESFSGGLA